jgi:predicted ATP-grasp superfamily ATP-dependent carboligase
MRTRSKSQIPAVLMDVNLQALKVVRSLGRAGIHVIGVVPEKGRWEHSSRYCDIRQCGRNRSDEELLGFYRELAEELGSKAVLVPMHDDNVLFVARHYEELIRHFRFLVPDPETTQALVSKSGCRALATKAGVPQPQTISISSEQDVAKILGQVRYPVLIKPVFSRSWQTPEAQELVGGKVVVVENDQHLVDQFALLSGLDNRLVLEELVPGPDRHLVYYIGYFDENSNPLASFVGVKERVIPVHFGSASYVVSRNDPRVIELSTRFMKHVGYKGHVGIEYKYDDRDDSFKLIEVNVRFGLWDGLPALCGIDFARINYQYLLGERVRCSPSFEDGLKWISFERDVRAFAKYRREGVLTFGEWVRSISTGRRDFAVFALDDPMPFIRSTVSFLTDQVRPKLLSMIRRSSAP